MPRALEEAHDAQLLLRGHAREDPVARERFLGVMAAQAARMAKNHRYSASRGIPNLRLAIANRYKLLFDVDLDPETDVVTTIGAKEGFTHLMWVLLGPGDSAIVPSPSYPIHLAGPGFAGPT